MANAGGAPIGTTDPGHSIFWRGFHESSRRPARPLVGRCPRFPRPARRVLEPAGRSPRLDIAGGDILDETPRTSPGDLAHWSVVVADRAVGDGRAVRGPDGGPLFPSRSARPARLLLAGHRANPGGRDRERGGPAAGAAALGTGASTSGGGQNPSESCAPTTLSVRDDPAGPG